MHKTRGGESEIEFDRLPNSGAPDRWLLSPGERAPCREDSSHRRPGFRSGMREALLSLPVQPAGAMAPHIRAIWFPAERTKHSSSVPSKRSPPDLHAGPWRRSDGRLMRNGWPPCAHAFSTNAAQLAARLASPPPILSFVGEVDLRARCRIATACSDKCRDDCFPPHRRIVPAGRRR